MIQMGSHQDESSLSDADVMNLEKQVRCYKYAQEYAHPLRFTFRVILIASNVV